MFLLKEELLWFTLKSQHLLQPVNDIQQIVQDLVGIQAQYFYNAVHALKLRYKGEVNQQSLSDLVKTWTVRGTLHINCKKDLSLLISALRNDWFKRWGKYLENYFTTEERDQWQREIYELIQSGVSDREMMVSYFSKKTNKDKLIKVALSSWGGILKDLAYQGKIIYSAADRTDFKLCDAILPIQEESAKIALIERYLVGYSPASINDIAYWSQLKISEVKKLLKKVKLPLQVILDDSKIEYYFLSNKLDMEKYSFPKYIFLAGFDPLLLGYKNKERFLNPKYHDLVFKKNGFVHSVLLHDGKTIGIWKKNDHTLDIQLFESFSERNRKLLFEAIHHIFVGEIKHVNFSGY